MPMDNQAHEWYLRIEAVNLDHSIFDTNDISTIRGGSSLLLEAVHKISDLIEKLEGVSVGASTGFYRIAASDEMECNAIKQSVQNYLQGEPYCHFATFVMATTARKKGESLTNLNKRLIAECGWQQYRTPSFSFPAYVETDEECGLGGVRPWFKPLKVKDKKASKSVYIRRDHGKYFRKTLYKQCFDGELPDIEFTNDLNSLAQNEDIALIHFDGNRFGNIRDECKIKEDYQQFDRVVQGIQKKALRKIIEYSIVQEKDRHSNQTTSLRLETLLWGGDEIELIVPASQAWKALKTFLEEATKTPFRTEAGMQFNLTYSTGVVFCRHNLPILQIRRYADQLCYLAKQQLSGNPEDFSNSDNRVAYLNMSSFDLIERDIESFINSYHAPATVKDFTFNLHEIGTMHNTMMTVTRLFPKNKVYDIVEALQRGSPIIEEVSSALKMAESSVRPALDQAIKELIGERKERWLLIGDLWNLIGKQAI
jgi:hypothetical protein